MCHGGSRTPLRSVLGQGGLGQPQPAVEDSRQQGSVAHGRSAGLGQPWEDCGEGNEGRGERPAPWGPQSRCFAPQSLVQGRASGARKKSQGVGAGQSRPLCALRPGTGCGPEPGWHLGCGDPRSAQWGAGQPLPVGRRACLPLSLPPLCRTCDCRPHPDFLHSN